MVLDRNMKSKDREQEKTHDKEKEKERNVENARQGLEKRSKDETE